MLNADAATATTAPSGWIADGLRRAFLLGPENRALLRRNVRLTALLVLAGVVGKLLLWDLANIETILAVSLLAGVVLRGAYVVLVPVITVLAVNALGYALRYPGLYSLPGVAGLTLFLVTGYLFVTAAGTRYRPGVLFRTRTIAVATAISVPFTVAFDVWTAVGEWFFISPYRPLASVFALQVPFTLVHVLSSLIFVPLLGFGFAYYVEHVLAAGEPSRARATSEQGLELLP